MVYVMSDTHGDLGRFDAMLDKICLSGGDRLYVLGDAIDRGPDGIMILESLMAMPNAAFLIGNHEDMLLRSLDLRGVANKHMFDIWMANGGRVTYEAFKSLPVERQGAILGFLEAAPDELRLEIGDCRFYLVHSAPGRDRESRLWDRQSRVLPKVSPGRQAVSGHTPVCYLYPSMSSYLDGCGDHMKIYVSPEFVDLDCGCGTKLPKACLSCLRLDDMSEFYVV